MAVTCMGALDNGEHVTAVDENGFGWQSASRRRHKIERDAEQRDLAKVRNELRSLGVLEARGNAHELRELVANIKRRMEIT